MIVVGIIGIVATLSYVGYQSHLLKARNRAAIADITTLDALVTSYESLNGDVPDALADLGDHGVGDDPWGNPYRFTNHDVLPGQERVTGPYAINSTYDLWSDGPDGTSQLSVENPASQDDIIRANDGAFIGMAIEY